MNIFTTGAIATSLVISSTAIQTGFSYLDQQNTKLNTFTNTHISEEYINDKQTLEKLTNTSLVYEPYYSNINNYVDTDVVTNDLNMTYEWLHNVDTSNWV